MATTELHKIPDTIRSRSQVYEFRTIPTDGDRRAAPPDLPTPRRSTPTDDAIALVARSAEGSMRDAAERARPGDRVRGRRVTVDDVATVLGLVGRDLLFDIVTAVADEDAARGVRAGGPRRRGRSRPAHAVPRARGVVRDMMIVVDRSVARWRRRAGARGRARAAHGADRRGSRARTCCARSTCSRRRSRTSAPRRSRATRSRWRW